MHLSFHVRSVRVGGDHFTRHSILKTPCRHAWQMFSNIVELLLTTLNSFDLDIESDAM